MQSAIDFGKSFLTQYFTKRDAEATRAFLAEDVIWITPNEIRHLKTSKSIRDFLAASMKEDPNAYNVDVASIKSAPVLETTSIVVFDLNLIPKHEESAVNLRCSLAFHKQGVGFAIVYVGMSRKYLRTDVEQIKSFADALPGGVMTIAARQNTVRLMYASDWFFRRLGYEEAAFYENMEKNSFFMMPYVEQKRMNTLVAEMAALKKPKPLAMRVNLLKKENRTKVPCHMWITAAYKDGGQTILYLTFDEIGDVITELHREHKKEAEAEKADQARKNEEQAGQSREKLDSLQKQYEQKIEDLRRDYEKQIAAVQIAANVRVEESAKLARDEADAAEKLIKAKLEQAIREKNAAVDAAKKEVTDLFAAAWKEEKEKNAAGRKDLQDQLEKAQKAADAAETENKDLKEQLEKLGAQHSASEQQYQDRILKMEWQSKRDAEDAQQRMEEFEKKMTAEKEEAVRAAEEEKNTAIRQSRVETAEVRRQAEEEKKQLSDTISRQQKDLENQKLSLEKAETDRAVLGKEKDKSILRMGSLLRGQMRSIRSAAGASKDETDAAKLQEQLRKIGEIAEEIPSLADDLTAISLMNPDERSVKEDAFTVKSCLNLVRKVIWPECRAKGLIFSIGVASGMPDNVIGNKAGLELAFLGILENAVLHTASGGRITMNAKADPPVRGSAYFHFTVSDTGQGIPEDRLPVLFDHPESELAIARKAIGTMGGAIQVRSKVGEGSSFEILVNLKLQQNKQ